MDKTVIIVQMTNVMSVFVIIIKFIMNDKEKLFYQRIASLTQKFFIIIREVAISMQPLYLSFNLYKTKKKQTTQKDTNAPFKLSITLS